MDAAEEEANAYVQGYQASKSDSPISNSSYIAAGLTAEGIIDIADGRQVNLIVICSHRRSGFGRWVFGSLAEKVLRGTNCVTGVIHGQEVSK